VEPKPEEGIKLDDERVGSTLHVTTQHTCYTIRMLFGRIALISGHPIYCPQPLLVTIHGPTWGSYTLKVGFIGRGMRLKFDHPAHRAPIITSPVKEIREAPTSDSWSIASLI
jgi:hypothetical protein